MPVPITDNASAKRFELEEDGHLAFADYSLDGDTLHIHYVEAAPALRGKGTAGRLMEAVAELARQNGWRIVPICGYAAAWLRRHGEYHQLLA
jgi:predicted GNAT family acetyltransferase